MADFDITSNIDAVLGFAAKLYADQLPFAAARALTRTQQLVRQAIETELPRAFDRPTPYTMAALRIEPATKQRLSSRVWFKDDTFKGIAATKYLGPQVDSGERGTKRFERALQARGLLPHGMVAVPGSAARMDGYGNIEPSQIVQILSYFDAFPQQGYRANMTQRRRDNLAKGKPSQGVRGYSYFALSKREGRLPPGIYQRMSYGNDKRIAHLQRGAAKPVFIFVGMPTYRARLDFYGIARRVTEAEFPRQLRESFDQAVRTAR